jgi:DNA-binding NarL/FixJ family response regulator
MMNSAIILVKEKQVLEEQIVDVLATAPNSLQMFGLAASRVRPYIPKKGSSLKQVENLTSRELQVLELLSTGLTYKEVSTKLNIGYETVRSHVKKFCLKLHARNRIEAMAKYRSKSP